MTYFSTMKRQSAEDRRFAALFAEALRPHVSRAIVKGESMAKIGAKLGVTGPGLQKYLDGGTVPSIGTVVRAYLQYGVSVPYAGVAFGEPRRSTRRRNVAEQQLFLPFEITSPIPRSRAQLKLLPAGARRYRLQVSLRLG